MLTGIGNSGQVTGWEVVRENKVCLFTLKRLIIVVVSIIEKLQDCD